MLSGLDLLVGQALRQIELMTGRTVAAEVLYAAWETARPGWRSSAKGDDPLNPRKSLRG